MRCRGSSKYIVLGPTLKVYGSNSILDMYSYITQVCWLMCALASISMPTTSTCPLKDASISGVHPCCVDNKSKECISIYHHSRTLYTVVTLVMQKA